MAVKLHEILAKILEIQKEEINDVISPKNTATWDSFNAVMMIAELEKASGANFDMADVMAVKNVGDIKKVLKKYNIAYEE